MNATAPRAARLEPGVACDAVELVARAVRAAETAGSTPEGVVAHGLGPLLADRLLVQRRPVPELLSSQWMQIARAERSTRELLGRVRDVLDGPVVLMKGAEVAAHYPSTGQRVWGDLDVLVPDAPAAQAALVARGFVEVGAVEASHHHEAVLVWPGVRLTLEVHQRPGVPVWATAPPVDALLDGAVPSRTGVAGILAPDPALHAVLVAAHGWYHCPFRSVRDLLDEELLLLSADRREAERWAASMGLRRMWSAERRAAACVLGNGLAVDELPRLERWLTAPLRAVRERSHVETLGALATGPLYADGLAGVGGGLAASAALLFRPQSSMRWYDLGRFRTRRL